MSRHVLWFVLAALAAGCAHSDRGAALQTGHPYESGGNLLLGTDRAAARWAEAYAGRSDWPTVATGVRYEDTTYVTEWSYDDESFTDRLGGGYYGARETIRARVIAR